MNKRIEKKRQKNEIQCRAQKTENIQTTASGLAPAAQTDFYIQYRDKEYLTDDIIEKIKKKCNSEGIDISTLDKLSVYLKPEENKAYYASKGVNGSIEL